MARLVGKPDELVLNARTIPRTDSFDLAAVHRRLVEIRADDLGRCLCCMGHPARRLGRPRDPSNARFSGMFHVEQILRVTGVVKGEQGGMKVALLLLHLTEVDAAPEDPGWGARLEAPQLDTNLQQA